MEVEYELRAREKSDHSLAMQIEEQTMLFDLEVIMMLLWGCRPYPPSPLFQETGAKWMKAALVEMELTKTVHHSSVREV